MQRYTDTGIQEKRDTDIQRYTYTLYTDTQMHRYIDTGIQRY